MPPFIQNLLSLPGKTKALLGVSAFAILAIAFLLLRIATAPSYALIATGLDPAQTGKITAALDEQGIAYELRNNGTGLAVAKTATAQARIALATQGVQSSGGGAQPGNELLDQSKLGASQFQQQMTAQRALEGEVAKTLRGIEGVSNPRVQIVMPQDDLFADEASSATAAVMLGNPSDTLAPGAVRGMAQLTASAVKGLKSDNVTISDSTGQVLWPAGDGATGVGGGSTKASAEARYARQLESSVNALMDSTLGPNKARIKVNADLNVDKTTQEELTYAKKGTPMKTSQETERLEGGTATTGGTAGTGANIPTYSAGAAGANGASNYRRAKKDTEMALDKKISKTEKAPGTVNKLNVALMVDKSVPEDVYESLQNDRGRRRRHRHRARRQAPADDDGLPQARSAQGRPGADHAARAAQVGRPRPREPALPVLHDARHAQARGRGARAELDHPDRGAHVAGAARGPQRPRLACSTAPPRRCSRRACRTAT